MTYDIKNGLPSGSIVQYADQSGTPEYGPYRITGWDSEYSVWDAVSVSDEEDDDSFSPREFERGTVLVVYVPDAGIGTVTGTSWNRALIALAIEHGRTLRFRYVKANGDIADRRVEPEGFHSAKRGGESVVGYDPDRDDIRAFRLDRIKGDVVA